MLTRLDIEILNKEISAAIRLVLAKFDEVAKGVVIHEVTTLREISEDGNSYEYSIKIRAQVVKEVETPT
jgi:hypothetical protein